MSGNARGRRAYGSGSLVRDGNSWIGQYYVEGGEEGPPLARSRQDGWILRGPYGEAGRGSPSRGDAGNDARGDDRSDLV